MILRNTQLRNNQKLLFLSLILLLLLIIVGIIVYLMDQDSNNTEPEIMNELVDDMLDDLESGDTNLHMTNPPDYENLPLGNNKYSDLPQVGYVYSCKTSFNGTGAFEYGPWIDQIAKTWDLTAKISVNGNVNWSQASWSASITSGMRMIESKDLPVGHTTGMYPIISTDDAYQYDRNPNSIEEQTISLQVPLNPTLLDEPHCVGGEVGIATTGVLIFNAFDAGGRDAVAVEIQDHCQGHPQAGNYYHYHGYSSCFEDSSGDGRHSDLIGYSFDGFGIFGLKGEDGFELSTQDLDECHGHTHAINWDGKIIEMYHYHFTQDFPYTVSCFRGEPAVIIT